MIGMNILNTKLTDEQKEIFEECKLSLQKHNQAAVLLSMGGGKSYIATSIVKYLKKNKKDFNIIWITTLNDMNKAKSLMSDEYFSESITYVTFNKLWRDNNYADELANMHKNYGLIVIDEAHHALAPQTYKGVKQILDKFNKAKLLVMTATKRRYSDRKHIFEWLTPKLKLGVDYKDRGLKYAINNKLTCDFVYKSCNIQMIKDYCNALKLLQEYSVIFKEFDDLIVKSNKIVDDYTKNIFTKLGEQMQQDLEVDGSQGDRWFVFFSTISEIQQTKDNIEELFKIAYSNTAAKINIIEYHSEITDNNVINNIICEPIKGQVDVILTCNKGSESLHPKNTRGIIMLRKTLSGTVFEQQIGRALEIREACSYVKYIYDCVDNKKNIDKNESIYNGKEALDERRILSAFNEISKSDDVLNMLNKKYGDTFDVEVMDSDLEDILKRYESVKDLFESYSQAEKIDYTLRHELGPDYINKILNNGVLLRNSLEQFDTRNKSNLLTVFNNIQNKFINGFFGEHYCDEEPVNDMYYKLFGTFNNILYLTPGCTGDSGYKLSDLIKIANEVAKYNYDYRKSISRTKELKTEIAKLRALNLQGRLSESYQKFCIRNKIDINGIYTNLIKEVLDSSEISKYPNLLNEFKTLAKRLSTFKNGYDGRELADEDKEELYNILVKEQIFTFKYKQNPYGYQTSTAINLTYRSILKLAKHLVSREDYIKAYRIMRGIVRAYILKDDNSIERLMSKDDEYAILDLIKRSEQNNVTLYELYMLENLDIRVLNKVNTNTNIYKLINITPFGIIYNRFIEQQSKNDYIKLSNYKIEGLPECARKLLRNNRYVQGKQTMETNSLLDKESKTVEQAVENLVFDNENSISIIKNAISNNEIDCRKILKYAIPSNIYKQNTKCFNKALTTDWSSLDEATKSVIVRSLEKSEACYDSIVENLIEYEIIPTEQMEFAKKLIEIAQ